MDVTFSSFFIMAFWLPFLFSRDLLSYENERNGEQWERSLPNIYQCLQLVKQFLYLLVLLRV